MHGAEDLHVSAGIETEAFREAIGDDIDGELGGLLGVFFGEEEEVGQIL
jgi:hypothetical protein